MSSKKKNTVFFFEILKIIYTYGQNRYNYVSRDKRFKTTIFGKSLEEVKTLFTNLLSVLGEPFEENNLSITSNRSRVNLTKRSVSLADIECNSVDYQTTFRL